MENHNIHFKKILFKNLNTHLDFLFVFSHYIYFPDEQGTLRPPPHAYGGIPVNTTSRKSKRWLRKMFWQLIIYETFILFNIRFYIIQHTVSFMQFTASGEIQGYPKRMRLLRRLYGIYTDCFHVYLLYSLKLLTLPNH